MPKAWIETWADAAFVAAHRWYKRAKSVAHLLGVLLRSWLKTNSCTDSRSPRACKAYVFNEDNNGKGFYREVSPHLLDPVTWESDVKEFTGWDKFRMELRYNYRNRKYRMVLRPGDKCVFPPYQDQSAPTCRLPKGVMSARLQGPVGSDIDHDVTNRVLKYQGPRGDFHAGLGLRVKLLDMFPFDDNADNSARFSHMRVMDTMGNVHDLPYSSNPDMVFKLKAKA